ncbi:basic proline-rich protein-like [Perognathus longimembris pacificus]|uniref:basic proline-rich protein-like n=1 Tax=Perognathus longimembris pacificus TaxID=214514 RepID=UPI0020184571|nr:basic proline-rich protein-like [Perognathus longimembris pacificus]
MEPGRARMNRRTSGRKEDPSGSGSKYAPLLLRRRNSRCSLSGKQQPHRTLPTFPAGHGRRANAPSPTPLLPRRRLGPGHPGTRHPRRPEDPAQRATPGGGPAVHRPRAPRPPSPERASRPPPPNLAAPSAASAQHPRPPPPNLAAPSASSAQHPRPPPPNLAAPSAASAQHPRRAPAGTRPAMCHPYPPTPPLRVNGTIRGSGTHPRGSKTGRVPVGSRGDPSPLTPPRAEDGGAKPARAAKPGRLIPTCDRPQAGRGGSGGAVPAVSGKAQGQASGPEFEPP